MFIVLIEYCVVLLYVHKVEKKKIGVERIESIESEKKFLVGKRGISLLEFYSKVCIALFFLGFNVVYWFYYVNKDYFCGQAYMLQNMFCLLISL